MLTATLASWVSGGVPQSPVVVTQEEGESVADFCDRCKRTFKFALDQHPPD